MTYQIGRGTPRARRGRSLSATCAGLVLLLTACAGDGQAGPAADDPSTGESAGAGAPAVGVTPDSIRLGYTQIDFDALREDFSVDLHFQNAEPVLEALVEEVNERGGIHGRRLEVDVEPYVPVGAASAEEVCVRFTEDDPVFAVLGGFAGMSTDVNSCVVTRNDTALVGGTWTTEEQRDAAQAPWLSVDMSLARRSVGFARALGELGQLDDVDKIAVLNSTAENEPFLPAVQDALRDGGTEVVVTGTVTGASGAAEARTLLERARSAGATAVFYSGLNPAIYPAFADHPEMRLFFEDATTTQAGLRDFLLAGHDLDIVSNGMFPLPHRDDPEMDECIEIVEERTDIVVADPNTLADDEPNWWQAVHASCTHLRLFEKVATAAGPDLTNESFLAAAEEMGEIRLPGVARGSLGPGKYDANDLTRLVTWDREAQDGEGGWVPIGDPFAVG